MTTATLEPVTAAESAKQAFGKLQDAILAKSRGEDIPGDVLLELCRAAGKEPAWADGKVALLGLRFAAEKLLDTPLDTKAIDADAAAATKAASDHDQATAEIRRAAKEAERKLAELHKRADELNREREEQLWQHKNRQTGAREHLKTTAHSAWENHSLSLGNSAHNANGRAYNLRDEARQLETYPVVTSQYPDAIRRECVWGNVQDILTQRRFHDPHHTDMETHPVSGKIKYLEGTLEKLPPSQRESVEYQLKMLREDLERAKSMYVEADKPDAQSAKWASQSEEAARNDFLRPTRIDWS